MLGVRAVMRPISNRSTETMTEGLGPCPVDPTETLDKLIVEFTGTIDRCHAVMREETSIASERSRACRQHAQLLKDKLAELKETQKAVKLSLKERK